jgi:hypothetical protein
VYIVYCDPVWKSSFVVPRSSLGRIIDLLLFFLTYDLETLGLDERDAPPAQAVYRELQFDQRSQLELVVHLVGAGMVGLGGEQVPEADQFVAAQDITGSAPPLGRRARIRLVESVPSPEQRPRGSDRNR